MTSFFKYIALVTFCVVFTLGCNDDNDDIVKSDDVTNLDISAGIVFGFVDQDCTARNTANDLADCNDVFLYRKDAIFKTTNNKGFTQTTNGVWQFSPTPLGDLQLTLSQGLENLPRGLRDVESKNILEFAKEPINLGENFYVFEFQTKNGNRKTIQFQRIPDNFNEEVKIYFQEMIKITNRLD